MATHEQETEAQTHAALFRQGCGQLGWIEERNIHFDFRWMHEDPTAAKANASELVSQNPDVIVANGTPIISPDGFAIGNRSLIISLAARYRLPAVYAYRAFAADGGLLSYGHDLSEPWRRAQSYVDKILKGASPADLPIQQPTKFEFVINLKTAKTLGLTIPPRSRASADEVIE